MSVKRVTGHGAFAGDLRVPGLLHVRVVRSPHAHARVLRIDTSAARALPGVVAILGHADVRTTLAIYTHSMRRKHDDSADKTADLAGLSGLGNKWETIDPAAPEEGEVSDCFNGSPGWNRTNDQRINSPTLYR